MTSEADKTTAVSSSPNKASGKLQETRLNTTKQMAVAEKGRQRRKRESGMKTIIIPEPRKQLKRVQEGSQRPGMQYLPRQPRDLKGQGGETLQRKDINRSPSQDLITHWLQQIMFSQRWEKKGGGQRQALIG